MILTKEQFDALVPYEKHFETAVRAKWARHPGSAALDLINDIYCQVTGVKQKINKSCSHCILNLITDMGKVFLADLEERKRRELGEKSERVGREIGEKSERKVAVKESLTTEPVKTEVKVTKRKYTKRAK